MKRIAWRWRPEGSNALKCGRWKVVEEYAGSRLSWLVRYKGVPLLRAHGNYTGYRRFGSAEAAMRWVEERDRKRAQIAKRRKRR